MKLADHEYQSALRILVKLLAIRNGSDTIRISFAEQQKILRAAEITRIDDLDPAISTWQDGLDIIVQLEYPDVRDS
jgi:hypothetical protein